MGGGVEKEIHVLFWFFAFLRKNYICVMFYFFLKKQIHLFYVLLWLKNLLCNKISFMHTHKKFQSLQQSRTGNR